MVIRKRMRIAAAVLVMCTMAGCSLFPDGTRVVEKDAGESTQQIDYNSDHIKSTVSDVLEIDADVYRTDKEFKSYTIDYSGVDSATADKHADVFAQDGKELSDRKEILDKTTGNVRNIMYKYSDGSSYTETFSMKMYTSKDASDRKYNLYVRLEKDKKDYLPLDELEDFSKEEAEKRARQYCDKLGITGVGDVIEYFAMDASHMTEIMNREENVQDLKYSGSLKSDNKEEITWNKEDEVYDFLFYKNIEGIPVAWAGAKSNNVNYSNPCYVRVVVGRDDIKLIADNYTYNITCGGSPENNQLCTLEDAITAFNTDNQELLAGQSAGLIIVESKNCYPILVEYEYDIEEVRKMKITEIRQVYCPLAKVMDDYYRGTEAVTYPVWQITYEVESATVKDGTAYRGVTKSIYIMNTTYNIIRKMSSQS